MDKISDCLKLVRNPRILKMPKKIVRLGILARLLQDLKLLFPLIKDFLKGTYRDVSIKSIVIFVITLAYIISPIDLIPDYIIGLGQIDDAAILGFSLYFLEKDLLKYKRWKDNNGHV
jgi:uncharacterized membrane protein YkvA (DUF1232 family)